MATAAPNTDASIKVMQDDLSCNICYNLLREPKDLDCPHIVCLQCLQKCVGNEPTVKCPECRYVTIVPQGGLVNLKTNLRLKSMAEKYAEHNGKQSFIPICPDHEGERQHFFCVTCGVTACHNCLVLQHRMPQHDVRELKHVVKTKKAEVKAKIGVVDKTLKDIKDDERKLDEIGRKLQAARKKSNKKVEKHEQEVISKVQAKAREMKGQIESTYQQQLEILEKKQQQTKDKLARLQNLRTATQNAVDGTADHVFMKQYVSLIDRMNEVMTEQAMPSPELATLDLQFKPGSSPVNPSWFGEVVDGHPMATPQFKPGTSAVKRSWWGEVVGSGSMAAPQFNSLSSPVNTSSFGEVVGGPGRKLELKRVHEFGAFMSATSAAETRSGLLAVVDRDFNGAGKVIVHRNVDGKFKQQFTLGSSSGNPDGKITKPFQVAVTSGDKFLVTCQCRRDIVSIENCVKIMLLFSSSGEYEKKLTGVGDRITTTPDDMIVTGRRVRTDDSSTYVITVHQSNGALLREHHIDCRSIADIASNGKQIAFTTGLFGKKIYVIDFVTGQVVWTVDMTMPLGICYEPKTNTLLVAGGSETDGRRVIKQYCSTTGQQISRLASGLYNPRAMTVTHDSKLVVADGETVKIYDIKVE